MAESPEHEFLKNEFGKILDDFSKLTLYGYTEADRKRFDLACMIQRDWSRPLIGQVLWRHTHGLDKDLRTLITDREAEIKVYLASNSVQHHRAFEEAIRDYRGSDESENISRLRTLWIPPDFDADREEQRVLISHILKDQIVDDLLFNVVFGRLTGHDIRVLLNVSGIIGLNIALLYFIATKGYFSYGEIQHGLKVSRGPIQEKLHVLAGVGFLITPYGITADYYDSTKGRVFLELIGRIVQESPPPFSPELNFILEKLGCSPRADDDAGAEEADWTRNTYSALRHTIDVAMKRWGLDFTSIDYSEKRAKYKDLMMSTEEATILGDEIKGIGAQKQ